MLRGDPVLAIVLAKTMMKSATGAERDPRLGPVDHVLVALARRRSSAMPATSEPAIGLGDGGGRESALPARIRGDRASCGTALPCSCKKHAPLRPESRTCCRRNRSTGRFPPSTIVRPPSCRARFRLRPPGQADSEQAQFGKLPVDLARKDVVPVDRRGLRQDSRLRKAPDGIPERFLLIGIEIFQGSPRVFSSCGRYATGPHGPLRQALLPGSRRRRSCPPIRWPCRSHR